MEGFKNTNSPNSLLTPRLFLSVTLGGGSISYFWGFLSMISLDFGKLKVCPDRDTFLYSLVFLFLDFPIQIAFICFSNRWETWIKATFVQRLCPHILRKALPSRILGSIPGPVMWRRMALWNMLVFSSSQFPTSAKLSFQTIPAAHALKVCKLVYMLYLISAS